VRTRKLRTHGLGIDVETDDVLEFLGELLWCAAIRDDRLKSMAVCSGERSRQYLLSCPELKLLRSIWESFE
jgi:hypothetical protein